MLVIAIEKDGFLSGSSQALLYEQRLSKSVNFNSFSMGPPFVLRGTRTRTTAYRVSEDIPSN